MSLTIFTVPRAFEGHDAIAQRNAIQSWKYLCPEADILLCGNDNGVAEAARELAVNHVPNVEKNSLGTPLLHSVFAQAHQRCITQLLCYINADIMLTRSFFRAVEHLPATTFLAAGQRWDVDITTPWNFASAQWEEQLVHSVRQQGVLHPPLGSDYFLFPSESPFSTLPAFAVGRPKWDNWMLHEALQHHIPVIDLSDIAMVVHQNHRHTAPLDERWTCSRSGQEAAENYALMGNNRYCLVDLHSATHAMNTHGRIVRKWLRFVYAHPRLLLLFRLVRLMPPC